MTGRDVCLFVVVTIVLSSLAWPCQAQDLALQSTGYLADGNQLTGVSPKGSGYYAMTNPSGSPILYDIAESGSDLTNSGSVLTLSSYSSCYGLESDSTNTYVYALCNDGTPDGFVVQIEVASNTITGTATVVSGSSFGSSSKLYLDGDTTLYICRTFGSLYKVTVNGNTLTVASSGGFPLSITSTLLSIAIGSNNYLFTAYLNSNAYIGYVDLSASTVTHTTAVYDISTELSVTVANYYSSFAAGTTFATCAQGGTSDTNLVIWNLSSGLIKFWTASDDGDSPANLQYCDTLTGDSSYAYMALASSTSDAGGALVAVSLTDGSSIISSRIPSVFPAATTTLSSRCHMSLDGTSIVWITGVTGSPPSTANLFVSNSLASTTTSTYSLLSDADAESAAYVMSSATAVAVAGSVAQAIVGSAASAIISSVASVGAGTLGTAAVATGVAASTGSSLTDVVSLLHSVAFIYLVASVDAEVPQDYLVFADSLGWASLNVVPPFDTGSWTTTLRRLLSADDVGGRSLASVTRGVGGSLHHEYWVGCLFYFTLIITAMLVAHAIAHTVVALLNKFIFQRKRLCIFSFALNINDEFAFPRPELIFISAMFPGIALATARTMREGDAMWSTLATLFLVLVVMPLSLVPAIVFYVGRKKYGLKFVSSHSGLCMVRLVREVLGKSDASCVKRTFCFCFRYSKTRELVSNQGEWIGSEAFLNHTDVLFAEKSIEGVFRVCLDMPLKIIRAAVVGILVGMGDDGYTQRVLLFLLALADTILTTILETNISAWRNLSDKICSVFQFLSMVIVLCLPPPGSVSVSGLDTNTVSRALYACTLIPLIIRIVSALGGLNLMLLCVCPQRGWTAILGVVTFVGGRFWPETKRLEVNNKIVKSFAAVGASAPGFVSQFLGVEPEIDAGSSADESEKDDNQGGDADTPGEVDEKPDDEDDKVIEMGPPSTTIAEWQPLHISMNGATI